jgi:hypothetical protein
VKHEFQVTLIINVIDTFSIEIINMTLGEGKELPGTLNCIQELTEIVPTICAIFTYNRELVFSNKALLDSFSISSVENILNKKPGDILHCEYTNETPDGCGYSKFCSFCSLNLALSESQRDNKTIEIESRISAIKGGNPFSYDLKVNIKPIVIGGKKYSFVTLINISDEKRRKALERIFFHDVINLAGGLKNVIELLQQTNDEETHKRLLSIAQDTSKALIDEILDQRNLNLAEKGELQLSLSQISAKNLVQQVIDHMQHHEVSTGKTIAILPHGVDIQLLSDEGLLKRILINMVKNALEAVDDDVTVEIGFSREESYITFIVKNPGFIPVSDQLQIFQRSFSTKGIERGLGTYSMKLLSERYLKGKVYFESSEDVGTTFYLTIPLKLD